MSQRLEKDWVVLASIENEQHDRCVDLFRRPDGSFGFEEFRRDPEDAGAWTPVQFYAGRRFTTSDDAVEAARRAVIWLGWNCGTARLQARSLATPALGEALLRQKIAKRSSASGGGRSQRLNRTL